VGAETSSSSGKPEKAMMTSPIYYCGLSNYIINKRKSMSL
jgi:hypothetical protein